VRKGCAIYLVGHGPRRQPRAIELQHVRILRYLHALERRLGTDFWTREVFVDLNWPRANYWVPEHFPELLKLAAAIREKSHDTVIVDLAPGDPRNWAPCDTIIPVLEGIGAKVYNAYFDDESALTEMIRDRYGKGADNVMFGSTPSDVSDFLAFFPALGSEIARHILRSEDDRYGGPLERVFSRLHQIAEENPYASGQYPFLEDRLQRRIWERTKEIEREEWKRRRNDGEQIFRLGPGHAGVLLEEGLYRADHTRSPQELEWAEKRLTQELQFSKEVDGQYVAYVRDFEGYRIFGDPRSKGSLGFRLYREEVPPSQPQRKRKTDPEISASSPDFCLLDTWKNRLEEKFLRLVRERLDFVRTSGRAR
jgi:hypothetical protein